jgi:hypothetical protein
MEDNAPEGRHHCIFVILSEHDPELCEGRASRRIYAFDFLGTLRQVIFFRGKHSGRMRLVQEDGWVALHSGYGMQGITHDK